MSTRYPVVIGLEPTTRVNILQNSISGTTIQQVQLRKNLYTFLTICRLQSHSVKRRQRGFKRRTDHFSWEEKTNETWGASKGSRSSRRHANSPTGQLADNEVKSPNSEMLKSGYLNNFSVLHMSNISADWFHYFCTVSAIFCMILMITLAIVNCYINTIALRIKPRSLRSLRFHGRHKQITW